MKNFNVYKFIPIIVFLLFSGISIQLWLRQNQNERETIERYTSATAEQICIRVEDLMKSCISSMSIMADRWVDRTPPDFSWKRFIQFANGFYTHYPGFAAINWIDPNGAIEWVYPESLSEFFKGKIVSGHFNLPSRNASKDKKSARFMVTPCEPLYQGRIGFHTFWPLLYEGKIQGLLNGIFQIQEIMSICLVKDTVDNFWVKIFENGQLIYSNGDAIEKYFPQSCIASDRDIKLPGKTWNIHIQPKASIYKQEDIPNLEFLIFSLLISWALSLGTHFHLQRMEMYQIARDRAIHEVVEKKRTQDALQVSLKELDSRVKELNCLFSITTLVQKQDISLDEILQGTVERIPPALQCPDITCVRIALKDREFVSKPYHHFDPNQPNINGDIIVRGESYGTLEAFYIDEIPEWGEMAFQKEEWNLIKDISQRLGRIIERKQSEQSFRALVENSLTGIFIVQENRTVYQNPEQDRLRGDFLGSSILTSLKTIYPDDVEKVKKFYEAVTSGNVKSLDTDFRFYHQDESSGKVDLKWVNCRASLIEYMGKQAILGNMMDITSTKELEHLLRIQDKMTSLGRVAAGMAHEIRNPLSGINIYLTTLEKIYDRGDNLEKVKDIIENIQSASAKIENVIKRVMDFSRPSAPSLTMGSINGPIEEAVSLSSVTMRKRGVRIEMHLSKDIPPCLLDSQLMEQVVLNLITNAAESMKTTHSEKIIEISSFLETNSIIVRVSDSGPGVPAHIREKIFDPFYSTKEGSTGIGLSICHRIVRDHGGTLNLSESKWGGAAFIINIPVKRKSK